MRDAFSLPDLRNRILFTLTMLAIFRFIAHVPLPGVDLEALHKLFQQNQLLGMLDLFSGGAMRNFSVAAMGVYPYITASIIMQLLVPVIPRLQALSREGEAGRHKVNVLTHWMTVPLAAGQGYGQLTLLRRTGIVMGNTEMLPTVAIVLSLVAGTIFLIWIGERITERGIGNGISIIIFGGIVSGLPGMIGRGLLVREQMSSLIIFILLSLAMVVTIVIFTQAARHIPVQYARSLFRGTRMYRQTGSTFIPLRVNTAGMIPLIFAMSMVIFPGTIASYFARPVGADPNFANRIMDIFNAGNWLYWLIYFLLVIAFAFFYTMVTFQQQNIADTLQKQGGFIPGIRPGKPTAEYLNRVILHITWGGALFLGLIAISPFLVQRGLTNVQALQLSSTGMLIVVGVVLDTMKQLEAQLLMRRYEGFIK
ncbi:preprotein translocase subunit SecY [Chloroflexota bacterium]